jgi:hypothetical protein
MPVSGRGETGKERRIAVCGPLPKEAVPTAASCLVLDDRSLPPLYVACSQFVGIIMYIVTQCCTMITFGD